MLVDILYGPRAVDTEAAKRSEHHRHHCVADMYNAKAITPQMIAYSAVVVRTDSFYFVSNLQSLSGILAGLVLRFYLGACGITRRITLTTELFTVPSFCDYQTPQIHGLRKIFKWWNV